MERGKKTIYLLPVLLGILSVALMMSGVAVVSALSFHAYAGYEVYKIILLVSSILLVLVFIWLIIASVKLKKKNLLPRLYGLKYCGTYIATVVILLIILKILEIVLYGI